MINKKSKSGGHRIHTVIVIKYSEIHIQQSLGDIQYIATETGDLHQTLQQARAYILYIFLDLWFDSCYSFI